MVGKACFIQTVQNKLYYTLLSLDSFDMGPRKAWYKPTHTIA